jgi:ATP-binding cassette, subfamily B, bacterial PglK
MQTLKKLFFLFNSYERKRAYLLLVMSFILAILETAGIASLIPFIAVLSNPEIVETNVLLNIAYTYLKIFGVTNVQNFLFFLGLIVFILLMTSFGFKVFLSYFQARFVGILEYSLSQRLVDGYLHQPYTWFLGRHGAEIGKNILSEISKIIIGGVVTSIDLINRSLVIIFILFLLIILDPKLAIISALTLGSSYVIITYLTNSFIKKLGIENFKSNEMRFKIINETFGAVKEIKVRGVEKIFANRYLKPAKILIKTQANLSIVSSLPRFFIEVIAFGGMLLILIFSMDKDNFEKILPIISVYAFAGYRLIPALQSVYNSYTGLIYSAPGINKIFSEIENFKIINYAKDQTGLSLNKSIVLKNVFFKYQDATRPTLKNINLTIPAKSSVGLIGASGIGKTTIVDIILGLLEPQEGALEVDGRVITNQNVRLWQESIGYVPQHIFLFDDTIAANIALGLEKKDINQEAVEKASKIANLHKFIIEELPAQYQTPIGERGVRLSGGQRQRIGIARALYHNPQLVIFDEATSALDNQTEKEVIDAINNLDKKITKILIAHRLNTIQNCDIVYKFENNQIVSQRALK